MVHPLSQQIPHQAGISIGDTGESNQEGGYELAHAKVSSEGS